MDQTRMLVHGLVTKVVRTVARRIVGCKITKEIL